MRAFALPILWLCAGAVVADDRDLLRDSSGEPYVFILFDTSGSMHWTPQCTAERLAAGDCTELCEDGDCYAVLNGDDPASKLYQAKEALYEVLQTVNGVNFGFATYNQDRLRVRAKHWLYTFATFEPDGDMTPNEGIALDSGTKYPSAGVEEVFGWGWDCDNGNNASLWARGCRPQYPADLHDAWELRRVRLLPKHCSTQSCDRSVYIREYPDPVRIDWTATPTLSYSNQDVSANVTVESADSILLEDNTWRRTTQTFEITATTVLEFDFQSTAQGEIHGIGFDENDTLGDARRIFQIHGNQNWGGAYHDYDDYSGSSFVHYEIPVGQFYTGSAMSLVLVNDNDAGSGNFGRFQNVEVYDDPTVYQVTYWQDDKDSWPYGAAKYRSKLKVERCDNSDCSNRTFKDEKYVYYDLVDEFLAWDIGASRGPRQMGFFSQGQASDQSASSTCNGLDDNTDTESDRYPDDASDYNLRWPSDASDPRNDTDDDGSNEINAFDVGDLIPLDWNTNHKADILARLAPGSRNGQPYFGVSGYLQDDRAGTCSHDGTACLKDTDCAGSATCGNRESVLRLKDDAQRPILGYGATPLGESIRDFRTWYAGCAAGACPNETGWEDIAAVQDPDWACRKKYLLVLTDGDETCSGDPCSGTANLKAQSSVKTFVVAFGVENNSGNTLSCMASEGGTGEPIYPQNKQELVAALTDIFNNIRIEARSFASASVPTVQNETSDKIYLSSFTPIPNISVWPGRIDAYRKPLPLNDDDTPYLPPASGSGEICSRCCEEAGLQSACHLWNAGDELLAQAPTPEEADAGTWKLGSGTGQRRVLYGIEPDPDDANLDVPASLRLLEPPADTPQQYDLWRGLGLIGGGVEDGDLSSAVEDAAAVAAERIIGNTLKIKTEVVVDPDGFAPDQVFEYVLGDIFHADPEIISSPNHLSYFRSDLFGYRQYSERHFWRRKMLVVAANDGQLHFFDAGIRKLIYDPTLGRHVARFTDGTGLELFSYMPRLAMPVVGQQFSGSAIADPHVAGAHVYSLDGLSSVADVYIDPLHDGTNVRAADRGWRTVLVGGLREGGDVLGGGTVPGFVSGYYALDLTQPDEIVTPTPTPQDPAPLPHPIPVGAVVPSCLVIDSDGEQQAAADCPTPAGSGSRFPAELWTFTDRVVDPDPDERELLFLDEDGNGFHDLGDSWSKPVVGQILVCAGQDCDPTFEPNDIESRFVAIFGGGLDSAAPGAARRGNWLYMVDIETGRAIYKRQLVGSAAAGPAALDRDQDGVLDVVYAATTAGYVYKVDLTALAGGEVPALVDVTLGNSALLGSPLATGSQITVERVVDPVWEPYPIFDTGARAIYMTPTLMLVPELDQYALAFGTGNRPDLWDRDGTVGRFYNLVDEDYLRLDPRSLPRTEAAYELVHFDALNASGSHLTGRLPGNRGWALELEEDDRVITQAFALVGTLVFTSFRPQDADPLDGSGDPTDPCARTGRSRIFVVDATNANAFTDLDQQTQASVERYLDVGDFTTSPYVDQTATKNPPAPSGAPGADDKHSGSALDAVQQALQEQIRTALKRYFPEGCRYNKSFSMTVNASRSDTGFVRYATIPIAMCPVDWKER